MKNRDNNRSNEVNKMEDFISVDYSECKSELIPSDYYDVNNFLL